MREREASPSLHPTGLAGLMRMCLWMNNLFLQTFQNATKMKGLKRILEKKSHRRQQSSASKVANFHAASRRQSITMMVTKSIPMKTSRVRVACKCRLVLRWSSPHNQGSRIPWGFSLTCRRVRGVFSASGGCSEVEPALGPWKPCISR